MEEFRKIEGYEGYEVSNYGRVKSTRFSKERILKQSASDGYLHINIYKDCKRKTINVHQLVAQAFLGHTANGHILVINHKDFNRGNNHIDNLEITTQRENSNRKHLKSNSICLGVHKRGKKYRAVVVVGRKDFYLGTFKTEGRASIAYQLAVHQIDKFKAYGNA